MPGSKGAPVIEKSEQENPFSMGPSSGRPQYQPDLSPRQRSMESFQDTSGTGTMMVDALVKFAGVAGEEYIKRNNVNIEADKAVQTALAVQGMAPNDKATVAGYRAHAAIAIQSQSMLSQVRLNELATQKTTDDEWKNAIREEYKGMDSYMMDTYENYGKDVELQKLSAVALREIMPQVGAKRESHKLAEEIAGRINSATDVITNAAKSGMLKQQKPEDAVAFLNNMIGPLKLTSAQKDSVLENAIVNTKDPDLINMAKAFKGDRKSDLYTRSGKVQSIDKANRDEIIANSSINLAEENRVLSEEFLSGKMTREELQFRINRRNAGTDNKFMSDSEYLALIAARDKTMSVENRIGEIKSAIQNPDITNMTGYKKDEVQTALAQIIQDRNKSVEEKASTMSKEDADAYRKAEGAKTTAYIGDWSVKGDTLLTDYLTDMHNLATMNVPANLLEGDFGKYTIEDLPVKAKSAMNTLNNLTPEARDEYLSALKSDDAKTLKNFMHLQEMGMPLTQALDRSQTLTKFAVPVDHKAVEEGVAAVRDKEEYYWWNKDAPEGQTAYLDQVLREKIMLDPNPNSDMNVQMVQRWMEKKWTTCDNGTRLYGTPKQLAIATGLHESRISFAMEAFTYYGKARAEPLLNGLGLEMEDVFPVTDPIKKTVSLRTKYGAIPGSTMEMSKLKEMSASYKVIAEKEYAESFMGVQESTAKAVGEAVSYKLNPVAEWIQKKYQDSKPDEIITPLSAEALYDKLYKK